MQEKALNAASTTQNNLRKGEEVLPIARAQYLQGLIEQIAGDVEKLKVIASQHSTKLRDVIRSGANKYHTDVSSVSIENLAAVVTHNYSQVAQGKSNIIDINNSSQRDMSRFKYRHQYDSDQTETEPVPLITESPVQHVPDKRLMEVIDRLNFDVSFNARRFKDENERLRMDLSRIVADNANIKMQLLHLEGSIKSLTMQSTRRDSGGAQVSKSVLQEEHIKSFDRDFNIIDRRIVKTANVSMETAPDVDFSKRLPSPARPQQTSRGNRRIPIRRHSLQDSLPTTPLDAVVSELHFVPDLFPPVLAAEQVSCTATSQAVMHTIVEKDATSASLPHVESSVYITSDAAFPTIAPDLKDLSTSDFSYLVSQPLDDKHVSDSANQDIENGNEGNSLIEKTGSLTLRDQIGSIFQENINIVRTIRETSSSISSLCMRNTIRKMDAVILPYDDSIHGSSIWSSHHSYTESPALIAIAEPSNTALPSIVSFEDRDRQTDLTKIKKSEVPGDSGAEIRASDLPTISKALHHLLSSMESKFRNEIGNESFVNGLSKLADLIDKLDLSQRTSAAEPMQPKSHSSSQTETHVKIPLPRFPIADNVDEEGKEEAKDRYQLDGTTTSSLVEANSSLASRIESSLSSVIQQPVDAIDGGIVYLPDFEGITFPAKAPVLISSAAGDLQPIVIEESPQIGELSTVDLGAEIILPTVTLARNGATPSKTFSNRQKESVNVRKNGHFDNRKAPVPSVSSSTITSTHNKAQADKAEVTFQDITQAVRKSPTHWSTKPRSAVINNEDNVPNNSSDHVADELEYYHVNGAKVFFDEDQVPEPEANDQTIQSISIGSEKSGTHGLVNLNSPSPNETIAEPPTGQPTHSRPQSHSFAQTEEQQQPQEVNNIVYHFESINREAILNDLIEYLDKKCADLEQTVKANTHRSIEFESSLNAAREEWHSTFIAQKENQQNDTNTVMHSLMHKIQEVEIAIDSKVREAQAPWLLVLEAVQGRCEQAEAISLQALEIVTKLNSQKLTSTGGQRKESYPNPARDAVKLAVQAVLAPDSSRNPNHTPSVGHVHSSHHGLDALSVSLTPHQLFPDIIHQPLGSTTPAVQTQPLSASTASWLLSESEVEQLLRRLREFAGNYDDLTDRFSILSDTVDKRLATVEKKLTHTHAYKGTINPNPKSTGPVRPSSPVGWGDGGGDSSGQADIAQMKQDLAMIWLRLQDVPPNLQRRAPDGKVLSSATTSSTTPVIRPNPPSAMPSTSIVAGTSFRKFR